VANETGEIRKPVGRDPVRRTRMKAGGLAAREALTRYRVVRRFPHFTLLEAEPLTGRTHQIRVHVSSLGHPIVGDTTYGAPGKVRLAGREVKALGRTFLHASQLEFSHPRTQQRLGFASPLPAELGSFLEAVAAKVVAPR
jgi:23S rRNA pseudouridine1911/1915/1917 synthase